MPSVVFSLTTSVRPPIELSNFVDGLHLDPPTLEFDASSDGTLTIDFHSGGDLSPPTEGAGDIASLTQSIVGGPQTFTANLASYPNETGYLHIRLTNGSDHSNRLVSQIITTPPAFTAAGLFGAGDKGFVIDPSVASTLYQDTAKTTLADTDGETIAAIVDAAGVMADLTQSNSSYRPVYKTNGSLHWILTGTNDFFTLPAGFLDNAKDWTFVFALSLETATSNSYFFGTTDQSYYFHYFSSPKFLRIQMPGNAIGGGSARPTGTAEVYTITWTRATGRIAYRVNGVELYSGTGTAADIPSKTWKLFNAYFDGSTDGVEMKHFFTLAIDRALGASELENIEQLAASRAGVTF